MRPSERGCLTYADLIQQRLQALSPAQQAEVFDVVEFLARRRVAAVAASAKPPEGAGPSPMANWFSHPIQVPAFTPLSRDEAKAHD